MDPYIVWLQTRLKELGYYTAGVDGDWGRMSIAALEQFQRTHGLKVTSVSDPATVAALKSTEASGKPAEEAPSETMPPWMAELHRRMGWHEGRDNKALSDWLEYGDYLGDPARLPWCGDAIETCIAKTLPGESLPSKPFWAQSWATFGVDVKEPIVGSIGVIRWNASSGHVGFVAGVSGNTVYMLGGNQSNMIRLSGFDRGTKTRGFMAFRWPKGFPVQKYPALQGSARSISGIASTR